VFIKVAIVVSLPLLRSDLNRGGSNESLIKGNDTTIANKHTKNWTSFEAVHYLVAILGRATKLRGGLRFIFSINTMMVQSKSVALRNTIGEGVYYSGSLFLCPIC